MKIDKNSDCKLRILTTILLSIFLIVSGFFIVDKCVFSSEEKVENPEEVETSISDQDNTETDIHQTEVQPISPVQGMIVSDPGILLPLLEGVNTGTEVILPENKEGVVLPDRQDINVIPDKYNTGCRGELTKVTGSMNVGGLELKESSGTVVFDFFYRNKDASGTYIIENYDFSDYDLIFNSEAKVTGKKIDVYFKNCRFNTVSTMRPASDVFTYSYYNCTFSKFSGSNSCFTRCKFGGSYKDGILPFSNVTVCDSYFSDFASNDPAGNGKHSDGTQMYGYSDSMVQNVLFSNCRFEIPAVKTTQSSAAVNACIMLSLEYNDAYNIRIEDCILNGGGYTIYAGKKNPELKMSEVYFSNIKIGDAKLFGNIYPSVDENVKMSNVENQDSLYVSSVWNDGLKTHVIVSNDTSRERVLRVVTGTCSKDYTIGSCLGGKTLRYDVVDVPFEDFPFDIDISVDSTADYVICFDVTDGYERKIRYVSFDGKPTYYDYNSSSLMPEESADALNPNLLEGKCGKNATYRLTSDGILKIEGSGNMDNYHSQKKAPWLDYSDSIVSIEISEGITSIGTQAFRNVMGIQSIELPESITVIESNAFSGCIGLKEITLHSGLTSIGKYAFNKTNIIRCNYYGNESEWEKITIGNNNDTLKSCEKVFINNS